MFDIKSTAEELDRLLHEIVVKHGLFIPIKKTLIRYKKYAIIKNNEGDWVVVLLEHGKKTHIATTFLKVTAFAACKLHEKKKTASLNDIKKDDELFRKHYINSLFYKKTARSSKVLETRENAQWRFEIAYTEAKQAKARIDKAFYASLV